MFWRDERIRIRIVIKSGRTHILMTFVQGNGQIVGSKKHFAKVGIIIYHSKNLLIQIYNRMYDITIQRRGDFLY